MYQLSQDSTAGTRLVEPALHGDLRDSAEEDGHIGRYGREGWLGGLRRNWASWVPYAAAVWSLAVAAMAGVWLVAGRGYPLPTDPQRSASVLAGLSAEAGSVMVLCGGLVAAALSLLAARGHILGRLNRVAVSALLLLAVPLLFLIPDSNLLVMIGYAPVFVFGTPFGWPGGSYLDLVTWETVFQLLSVVGGLLLVSAALVLRRRARRSCNSCGRTALRVRWSTPDSATVWGRWAVLVAVLVPLVYGMDRWAWAAGIPVGISQDFLDEMHRTGMVWSGFGLGTFALIGAVLTLGLAQGWGETFPRWMLGLAGKRVPPMLAIVPATLVSILVMSATAPILKTGLGIAEANGPGSMGWLQVAILGAFPIWSAALGAATLAYHLRRRGPCPSCHRD